MTDPRAYLESQATVLHSQAESLILVVGTDDPEFKRPHALATLINGMLEDHAECVRFLDEMTATPACTLLGVTVQAAAEASVETASKLLERLVSYVSAVTGNTPPEGAP